MTHRLPPATLPARAGLGLKLVHVEEILEHEPEVGFFEAHAENFMGAGGPPHRCLARVRERYPLSLHGVGLSIGGEGPLDREHLARLKGLCERYAPSAFSEHLAWSSHGEIFLNDLLPVAYDQATLDRVCAHIDEIQAVLKRRMLLENPSTYLGFAASTMSEIEFLGAVAKRTGCGLLLDVSNVHVSATNHGFDPLDYLEQFPLAEVGEIHLAGFACDRDAAGAPLLIDAHGTPVAAEVWALYRHTIARTGPLPTLIEWDNDVPPLPVLLDEAAKADRLLRAGSARQAPAAA